MSKLLLFLLVAVPATVVQAYSHPQYFYQADLKNSVLTPRLYAIEGTSELNNFKTETAAKEAAIEFEYGFFDRLSVGANWGFRQTDVKNPVANYKYSGMRDLNIFAKAFYPMGDFRLRYGASLGFGSIAEEDSNGRPSNSYSGRYELEPYIGFDYKLGSSFLGAKLATELLIGDAKTKLASGVERTETGGNTSTLGLFYEYHSKTMLFGASFEYQNTSDASGQTPGGGSTNSEFISVLDFDFYGSFELMENFDLIPQLSYSTTTDDELSGSRIDTFSIVGFRVDARFTF